MLQAMAARSHQVAPWLSIGPSNPGEFRFSAGACPESRCAAKGARSPEMLNGDAHNPTGIYQEVVPEKTLVFTWDLPGTMVRGFRRMCPTAIISRIDRID